MYFYLAARWRRRAEVEGYAVQLRDAGHVVTSRWLTDPEHRLTEGRESQVFNASLAGHDVDDIIAADVLIYFAPGGTRGGSHVEFGMAWSLQKSLMWIGAREHVFSYMPNVAVFPDWESCFDSIRPPREA